MSQAGYRQAGGPQEITSAGGRAHAPAGEERAALKAARFASPIPNASTAAVGKLRQEARGLGREQPIPGPPPTSTTSESRFGDAVGFAAEAGDGAELQQQSHGAELGAQRGGTRSGAGSGAER